MYYIVSISFVDHPQLITTTAVFALSPPAECYGRLEQCRCEQSTNINYQPTNKKIGQWGKSKGWIVVDGVSPRKKNSVWSKTFVFFGLLKQTGPLKITSLTPKKPRLFVFVAPWIPHESQLTPFQRGRTKSDPVTQAKVTSGLAGDVSSDSFRWIIMCWSLCKSI